MSKQSRREPFTGKDDELVPGFQLGQDYTVLTPDPEKVERERARQIAHIEKITAPKAPVKTTSKAASPAKEVKTDG